MMNNPYIGPRAFNTGELLYGREREIRDLLALLIAERIVLMYSPSGAGKTSLIQAAIVPALIEKNFQVLPVMRVSSELSAEEKRTITVTNRYVLSALLSLEKGCPEEQQTPLANLAAMSFSDYLDSDAHRRATGEVRSLRARRKGPLPKMLIFDQFEELLTVDPTDQSAKGKFFDQVGAVLRDRECWALFSMREDYLAGLDPFLRRVPTRLSTKLRLDLLGEESARLAIQKPAASQEVEFGNDAAEKLINDLRTVLVQQSDGSMGKQLGPHIEPVQLQVVCSRLWDKLPDETKTIAPADVETIGDVNEALSGYYADEVKKVAEATKEAEGMEAVSERVIREWFDNNLITDQGIRGQVPQGKDESRGLKNEVIRPLIDAHLVRAEKRRGTTWFELAHDRLIEPVQSDNAEWLQRNLNDFQRTAGLWHKQGRPDTLLLPSLALAEANDWAQSHEKHLTSVEQDFLKKSLELQQRAEREQKQQDRFRRKKRQARRDRIVAAIMSAVGLFAMLALVGVVIKEKQLGAQKLIADAEKNRAIEANKIAIGETQKAIEANKIAQDNLERANMELQKEAELKAAREEFSAKEEILRAETNRLLTMLRQKNNPTPANSVTTADSKPAQDEETKKQIDKVDKLMKQAAKKAMDVTSRKP